MSKLKKVVAALIAAATVSALSISVFAEEYSHPPFNFDLKGSNYAFTEDKSPKEDNQDYAMARCKEGNLTNTRYMTFSVYKQKIHLSTYCVSYKTTAYSAGNAEDNYQINYKSTSLPSKGDELYLCGETGQYSAKASGKWDP